jgi:hypothetical protein
MTDAYLFHKREDGRMDRYNISPDVALLLKTAMYWTRCLTEDKTAYRYVSARTNTAQKNGSAPQFDFIEASGLYSAILTDQNHLRNTLNELSQTGVPRWVSFKAVRYALRNEIAAQIIPNFCDYENTRFERFHPEALKGIMDMDERTTEDPVVYRLQCGSGSPLHYDVTKKAEAVIRGAMYWSHCLMLDTREYEAAKGNRAARGNESRYTEADLNELKHIIDNEQDTLYDLMSQMEELHVPNWVGNGAMQWAKDHDLREHYMQGFFTTSQYAVREKEEER